MRRSLPRDRATSACEGARRLRYSTVARGTLNHAQTRRSERAAKLGDGRAALAGYHRVLLEASFSTCAFRYTLSACSATKRESNRLFFSSAFRRWTSIRFTSQHFRRQRCSVSIEMPCRRMSSADASPPACYCRICTTCSSMYRRSCTAAAASLSPSRPPRPSVQLHAFDDNWISIREKRIVYTSVFPDVTFDWQNMPM